MCVNAFGDAINAVDAVPPSSLGLGRERSPPWTGGEALVRVAGEEPFHKAGEAGPLLPHGLPDHWERGIRHLVRDGRGAPPSPPKTENY